MADLVTLTDVFALLNVAADPQGFLAREIKSASARVRRLCPGWSFDAPASKTVDLDGGGDRLILPTLPVVSVTSVTDRWGDDAALAAGDFGLDSAAGSLFLADDDGLPSGEPWGEGEKRFRVVYSCGFAEVPDEVKEAALAFVADAWGRRNPRVRSSSVGGVSKTFDGSAVPAEVLSMLGRYRDLVF